MVAVLVAAARQELFGSHPSPGSSHLISSRPSNQVFETFTDVSCPYRYPQHLTMTHPHTPCASLLYSWSKMPQVLKGVVLLRLHVDLWNSQDETVSCLRGPRLGLTHTCPHLSPHTAYACPGCIQGLSADHDSLVICCNRTLQSFVTDHPCLPFCGNSIPHQSSLLIPASCTHGYQCQRWCTRYCCGKLANPSHIALWHMKCMLRSVSVVVSASAHL